MQCIQDRPFCAHMGAVFFQPCERQTSSTGDFQYLLFYQMPIPDEFSGNKRLFQLNGSTLLAA